MKMKLFCVLGLAVLMGALSACSQNSPASSSPPPSQSSSQPEQGKGEEVTTQLPNPVVEYDGTDFTDAAGFAVTHLPDGYALKRSALIGGTVAEMVLTPDSATGQSISYTLRVAVDSGEDISGVYMTSPTTQTQELGGVSVEIRQDGEGEMVASWTRDGYRYSLDPKGASQKEFEDLISALMKDFTMSPATAPKV